MQALHITTEPAGALNAYKAFNANCCDGGNLVEHTS